MRYFYSGLFAMVLSIACWADISPKNDIVYKEAWDLYFHKKNVEAIALCQKVLEDGEMPNVDRLHFYMTTYIFTGDIEYRNRFDELIQKDVNCRDEYRLYYN